MKSLLASLCVLAALAFAPPVLAETTGAILGTVTDPQGAVVAGATVTVRQTATNLTRTATTDQAGAYRFSALPLGPYEVSVEATGFRPGTVKLTLEINQERRADVTLLVEGVSGESVDVVASDVIQSETSTVGTVIDNQKITDLPLNGRNFLQLGALIPGVAAAPGGGGSEGGTYVGAFSVGGQRDRGANYQLDGADNNQGINNNAAAFVNVDAIQEFTIQTSSFSAEYGRNSGAVVNVATRSGTNEFHGTAFEFLRNDKLDARPYFFKDPESPTQTAPLKAPYRQNQYGGTLSGPVRIPKLFNGKDRLFFMANYEGFKSRRSVPSFFTTMTPEMRVGNFSAFTGALQDPNTRVRGDGGTITSSAFPGNQIPASRISAGSKYLLDGFAPLPNLAQAGLPNRNFQYVAKTPVDKDQFTGRIDFNESSNSQWFGRYSWTDELTITPGVQLNGTGLYTRASQWMLSNTRVFSSSKINEFRFGWYNDKQYDYPNDELAIPGIGMLGISAGGQSNLGTATDYPRKNPLENRYQLADTLTWTRGKHTLKVGMDFMNTNDLTDLLFNRTGTYTYQTWSNFAADFSGNTTNAQRWQRFLHERIGAGRLSELLGDTTLDIDKFQRTMGYYRAAESDYAVLSARSRMALDAYAAGVNAWIDEGHTLPPEFLLLGAKPAPWKPIDSLVWEKMMSWDLGGDYDMELLRLRLGQALGPERAAQLLPPYPEDALNILPKEAFSIASVDLLRIDQSLQLDYGRGGREIGSNNWVVSGSRTA